MDTISPTPTAENRSGNSIFSGHFCYSAISRNSRIMIGHKDFSIVVRRCAPPPRPWRWEIYRAGRKSAIQCSKILFETVIEANRAGSAALVSLLSEHSD
jgi:hypothetical protein